MFILSGYQTLRQIYESANSLVYRAIRTSEGQLVILKLLKQDYPTPEELVRYRQEYEITHKLRIEGVCRSLSLEKYQNTFVIVFEDFGGESLKSCMNNRLLNLEEFLQLAIATTASLAQVHTANIIHKDINPSNIVYNPDTKQLKIIDFGISTVLSRENQALKNPNALEGTLAYMSPEQTGRMNRSLDYRTDFYSLGVTFYEMLTKKLPFETTDALELVHSHIAKPPLPPFEVNPQIPQVVSDIVMKLMAKNAEERYQSAFGIKADLEQCLNQLHRTGRISDFPLAGKDISDKFQIPQKLYGREREIGTLLKAFERASDRSEIMLIAGYSGIGKSALVQELYKPITEKRSYFISGKFDQYQRDIPYSAIVSAFRELVKQLLMESEAQLQEWRQKLLAALGINGQVLIDVIPEMELIMGKQTPVPELGATEAQNRFNLVFQNYIKVFTDTSHTLALFLDDLQWADGASLKLIQVLIDARASGLFLIGAYRDNEVIPAHPLMLTLEEIGKTGVIVNQVFLSALHLTTVNQIICDTLNCSEKKAQPLAELVFCKTEGNPFFMNEFLKSIYTEGLIEFDFQTLNWCWNLERIQVRGFTDNVVELMASKIQKLPDNTQEMLKIAACIGNQFDVKTLALICEKSLRETANDLQASVTSSLIGLLGSREDLELALMEIEAANEPLVIINLLLPEYKFAHDRIQQAAYSLISEQQKPIIHRKIGQVLLQNTPSDKQEEKIFDIVNQLNFGRELISNQSERDELAELNLQAAKKAKASAAYQSAFNYLHLSKELLSDNSWNNRYNLTLELHLEIIEITYLKGDFEQMDALTEFVQNKAKNVLDEIKVIEIKIIALIAQGKLEQALDLGLQILRQLKVKMPKKPTKLNTLVGFLETKVALLGKRIEALADRPSMSDPYRLSALSILSKIISAAYMSAPEFLPLISFHQVILSTKYGTSPDSISGYSLYGLVLCGVLEDIELGYEFGQLVSRVLKQFSAIKFQTKALMIVNYYIKPWRMPIKDILQPLLETYKSGIEIGDLEWSIYAANGYCHYSYMIGSELSELEQKIDSYIELAKQFKQGQTLYHIQPFHQAVINLINESGNTSSLVGNAYNEYNILPLLKQINHGTAIFYLYLNKLILSYLFEQYTEAVSNSVNAEDYVRNASGSLLVTHFYFYDSLAHLAVYPTAAKADQVIYLKKVLTNQIKMKKWVNYAPTNHLHKFYLVEAEKYRVLGKDALAMDYSDRAIALAKENEYIHEAALAYELAAKFYLSKGKELTARSYMQEARYCYQLWGAIAKVKDLEKRYSQLLGINQPGIQKTKTTTITTSDNSGLNLDIATVMKASQAISGEILLDKLLSNLMNILIENAGAQKGYLILENQGKLLIEAEGAIASEQVTVLQSIPLEARHTVPLPVAIINYVARTKESVVLNDATHEGKFLNDSYIKENQPQSILCVPLINQGKLISIIYLEHNSATGVFTPERVEVLKLLSGQAAISIENARFYNKMAELNKAYERFVPRQFLQYLDKSSIIDVKLGDQVQLEMSVLFSDIRDFTALSEKMTPQDNFKFINSYLSRLEPAITEHHGFIDKYIGDAIMALFSGEADNAVKAGIAMLHRLQDYNQYRANSGCAPIKNGIGINTGLLILGTVGGQNRMDGTVISDAVNLASRIESLTKEYGVSLLISQQTFSRLQHPRDYAIREVDRVKVKGKEEVVTVYEVFDADRSEIKEKKLATLQAYTEACSYYNLNVFTEAVKRFENCLQQNPDDRVVQIYLKRCQEKISSTYK